MKNIKGKPKVHFALKNNVIDIHRLRYTLHTPFTQHVNKKKTVMNLRYCRIMPKPWRAKPAGVGWEGTRGLLDLHCHAKNAPCLPADRRLNGQNGHAYPYSLEGFNSKIWTCVTAY